MNKRTILPEQMTDERLRRVFDGCQDSIENDSGIVYAIACAYSRDLYAEIQKRGLVVELSESTQNLFDERD